MEKSHLPLPSAYSFVSNILFGAESFDPPLVMIWRKSWNSVIKSSSISAIQPLKDSKSCALAESHFQRRPKPSSLLSTISSVIFFPLRNCPRAKWSVASARGIAFFFLLMYTCCLDDTAAAVIRNENPLVSPMQIKPKLH